MAVDYRYAHAIVVPYIWLAGALLIREAGGVVTDLHCSPFGWSGNGVLAGNATIHATLLPIVAVHG